MAKSVGNIRGLGEVLDDVGGEVLVLFLSSGHYRQPLAFSDERLEDAKRSAARIRDAGRRLVAGPSPEALAPHRDAFFAALRNDFNTAEALASLYGWIREANRSEEPVGDAHLREMLDVLGLVGLLAAEEGPPEEAVELAALRDAGAPRQGLGRGRPAARRAARAWAGRSATGPTGPSWCRRHEPARRQGRRAAPAASPPAGRAGGPGRGGPPKPRGRSPRRRPRGGAGRGGAPGRGGGSGAARAVARRSRGGGRAAAARGARRRLGRGGARGAAAAAPGGGGGGAAARPGRGGAPGGGAAARWRAGPRRRSAAAERRARWRSARRRAEPAAARARRARRRRPRDGGAPRGGDAPGP